ncbi:MAG: hypothetical protein ACRCZQ_08525, partial [Bacteroidales bacterium]
YLIISTNFLHKQGDEDQELKMPENLIAKSFNKAGVFNAVYDRIENATERVSGMYDTAIESIVQNNLKDLKVANKEAAEFNQYTKNIKRNIPEMMANMTEESIETGHYYVQILEQMRDIAHCITFITQPSFEHINNNHTPFHEEQNEALKTLQKRFDSFMNLIKMTLKDKRFEDFTPILEGRDEILTLITDLQKDHLRYLREYHVSTKSSVLYLAILNQSRYLVIHMASLMKALKAFYQYKPNM